MSISEGSYFHGTYWPDPMIDGSMIFDQDNNASLGIHSISAPVTPAFPQMPHSFFNSNFNYDEGYLDTPTAGGIGDYGSMAGATIATMDGSTDTREDGTSSVSVSSPQIDMSRFQIGDTNKNLGNEEYGSKCKKTRTSFPRKKETVAEKEKPTKIQIGRNTSLERNRLAAEKSRMRNKERVRNLVSRKESLESKHHNLKAEHLKLLQETMQLRSEVLNHANCHDCKVDAWIKSEAQTYVRRLSSD